MTDSYNVNAQIVPDDEILASDFSEIFESTQNNFGQIESNLEIEEALLEQNPTSIGGGVADEIDDFFNDSDIFSDLDLFNNL